jgi:D-3-phosphoglycerate dehydrogenase / 2-oxoglutarate reductase
MLLPVTEYGAGARMGTVDDLQRWRTPGAWRRPGAVTITQRSAVRAGDASVAALQAAGIAVTTAPLHDEQGVVSAAVQRADVVISGGQRLTAEEIGQMRSCRLLLRPYVGYDDIDVDAATSNSILFANVPDAFSEEVANHALALILALNRGLLRMDRYVRDGSWGQRRTRADLELHRPAAQTLGLVGFGVIARMVAERARPFGYRLLVSDPYIPASIAADYGATLVPLEHLLAESDVVSLHVLLNDETRGLMNGRRLARMKPGAALINTCRGPVVEEAALVASLRSGHLGGAGLDVFEREPIGPDHPLVDMEQVILTPHAASQSVEGAAQLRRRVAEIAASVASGALPERKVVVNKTLYDRLAALPELANVPRS